MGPCASPQGPTRSHGAPRGMGKESWVLVACVAAVLGSVGLYLEDARIRVESGGITGLFSIRSSVERRRNRIVDEMTRLGPGVSWAGAYYCGDGLGFNMDLLIAPDSGYVFSRFYDNGGLSEDEDGSFVVRDDIIYFPRSREDILRHGLRPVAWDGRSYMIPVGALIDFCKGRHFT